MDDLHLFKSIQQDILSFITNNQGCKENFLLRTLNEVYKIADVKIVLEILENNYTTFFKDFGRIISYQNKWFHFDENHKLARLQYNKIILALKNI